MMDEEGILDQAAENPPLTRPEVSQLKGRWRKMVRKADQDCIVIAKDDMRGGMTIPIMDYRKVARRIFRLGQRGEEILDMSINVGLQPHAIEDTRDLLEMLEIYSDKILKIITKKWGQAPEDWPAYTSPSTAVHELVSQSNAIRELEQLEAELDDV